MTSSASTSPAPRAGHPSELRARAVAVLDGLGGLAVFPTIAKLTLLLLALYSGGSWGVRVPMTILCTLGIIDDRIAVSVATWMSVTLLLMASHLTQIYVIDNHKVLMVYWCLALALCLARPSHLALRRLARTMVGACFALAVFWKLVSPDFLDGSFFHFTLLTDDRFEAFMVWVSGISPTVLARNASDMSELAAGGASEVFLRSTPSVAALARGMTIWTILIETAVALAFLAPSRFERLDRWRNGILGFFVFTTYPVATVIGFGWLLCILGFAQCRHYERRAKLMYLVLFLLLQVYLVPWSQVTQLTVRLY